MKKTIIIMLALLVILFFGCTQTQVDSNIDVNNVGSNTDSNTDSNNHLVYNNLTTLEKAKSGDMVKVHYTLMDVNQNILETSTKGNPIEFVIDSGKMIKGFNDAVKGMKVGETKIVTLNPNLAYGEKNPELIVTFDKNEVPNFDLIKVGEEYSGGPYNYSKVLEKTDRNVLIDFNHRLSGQTLIFEIKLVSIN